jgi:hypothetical protein
MIKPEQIPDEVVEAAAKSISEFSEPIDKWRYHIPEARDAIAAAINAWPGMECRPTFTPSRIILPLAEEPST